MRNMDDITVFTPAPGQPRFQMSADCFRFIKDTIKRETGRAVAERFDDTAKDVARKILLDVEEIAATGQPDSIGDICEFLKDYYGLNK